MGVGEERHTGHRVRIVGTDIVRIPSLAGWETEMRQ
jgi:hypothetical protein